MDQQPATEITVSPAFRIIRGVATVTSIDVARHFEKEHFNVLRDIRGILEIQPPEWGVINFEETHHINPQNGQQYPLYNITFKGFCMLAFGFTGVRAATFKRIYIDEFERMAAQLNGGSADKANAEILRALHEAQINNARMMRNFQKIMGQIMRTAGLPKPAPQPDPERAFTDQERAKALFLFREGTSAKGISKRLNRTHGAVARWMATEPECIAAFVQRSLI